MTEWVPVTRPAITFCPELEMVPVASPVKLRVPGAPSGSVCSSTMLPRWRLEKVRVPVSPGWRLAMGVPGAASQLLLSSPYAIEVSSKAELGPVSTIAQLPEMTPLKGCVPSSARLKVRIPRVPDSPKGRPARSRPGGPQ